MGTANETKPGTIVKHFARLRQAEKYQERLYDKYDHVRLIRCPLSDEDGLYIWEVK